MTYQVRRSITIDAAPEEIWSCLGNPEVELRWRSPQLVAEEKLDERPVRPGTGFRGTAEVLGKTDTWVSEITVADEPRLMAWRAVETTAPARAPGRYELEPVDGATRMTIQIDYEPIGLKGRLALPIMSRLVIPRIIDGFLRQLRELVESRDDTNARD